MIKVVDSFDVSEIKEIVKEIEMKKCPFCGGAMAKWCSTAQSIIWLGALLARQKYMNIILTRKMRLKRGTFDTPTNT